MGSRLTVYMQFCQILANVLEKAAEKDVLIHQLAERCSSCSECK